MKNTRIKNSEFRSQKAGPGGMEAARSENVALPSAVRELTRLALVVSGAKTPTIYRRLQAFTAVYRPPPPRGCFLGRSELEVGRWGKAKGENGEE
jgi:hypothetical protein